MRLSSSLERKNEKKNDEFCLDFVDVFSKIKNEKEEPAKKVWCLVIKMIKDKKRGKPIILVCGLKKMKTRRESLKEEEEH